MVAVSEALHVLEAEKAAVDSLLENLSEPMILPFSRYHLESLKSDLRTASDRLGKMIRSLSRLEATNA